MKKSTPEEWAEARRLFEEGRKPGGQVARAELARRAARDASGKPDPHELIQQQESPQAFTRRQLEELRRLDEIKSLRKKYRKKK